MRGAEWASGDEPGGRRAVTNPISGIFELVVVNTFIYTFDCFLNIIEFIILLEKLRRFRLHAVHRRLLGGHLASWCQLR